MQSVTVLSVDQFQTLLTDETESDEAADDAEIEPPPVTAAILPELLNGDLSSNSEPVLAPPLPTEHDNPVPEEVPQIAPQPPEPIENDLVIDTEPMVPPTAIPEEPPQSTDAESVAADRVAPTVSEKPPSDAETDVFEQPAISVDGEGAPADQPAQQARALEEATRQIVTEAEVSRTDNRVEQSIAPPARPSPRPPTQAPTPDPSREETEEPARINDLQIATAIAEALQDIPIDQPQSQPLSTSALQLTSGEKEALTLAVSNCWNVGSLSTEALQTSVVVAVTMSEDALPVISEIRLLSYSGGPESAARQSFEAARRAIIRCGTRGFNLPIEKFEHWRNIEMTFNPEYMSIR